MRKVLTKTDRNLHYFEDGKRVEGPNPDLRGDCSDLWGNCTGLRGDCTGLRGDLDDAELTAEERKKGVNIADLVGGEG